MLERISCPLGVLGVVFEARPEALVQITGLGWKSGNAVVLKGGREARHSNRALAELARKVLADQGLDAGALVLLEERSEVDVLLGLDDLVDMIIARGSSSFIHHVRGKSRIPVMAHADGICHVYLHGRRRSRQGGAGGARFEGHATRRPATRSRRCCGNRGRRRRWTPACRRWARRGSSCAAARPPATATPT